MNMDPNFYIKQIAATVDGQIERFQKLGYITPSLEAIRNIYLPRLTVACSANFYEVDDDVVLP